MACARIYTSFKVLRVTGAHIHVIIVAMDLSGIAAICALAGIPVTVVVARWQTRTALKQAEAAHRTALAQVEATHHHALEAADKAHQNTLEVLTRQHQAEVDSWRRAARHAAYGRFQETLARARLAFLAEPIDSYEADLAGQEIHEINHEVAMVASDKVAQMVSELTGRVRFLCTACGGTVERRRERWSRQVAPLRRELDEAIRKELGSERWGPGSRNDFARSEPPDLGG